LKTKLTLLTHCMTLTATNFVHVSGRSFYIVEWRVVVVEGRNVLHHVKKRGNVLGNMSGKYVQGERSVSRSRD